MQDMFVAMSMSDGERVEERSTVVRSPGAATMQGLYQHAKQTLFSEPMQKDGGVIYFGAWPNEIPAEPGGR